MTIKEIISNRSGKAGSNQSWRVSKLATFDSDRNASHYTLWHYSTLMLRWREEGKQLTVEYAGLGNGTVSDQQGMNAAFKVLGVPYYYSRKGGAEIRDLTL